MYSMKTSLGDNMTIVRCDGSCDSHPDQDLFKACDLRRVKNESRPAAKSQALGSEDDAGSLQLLQDS